MSEVEKINGYEIHPYASRFPLLAGEKFDELVASIKMNGLGEKIILDHLGNVVDGRNRLKACGKAGVAPQFKQLDEDADILEIVLDRNVRRRHLTPSQLAMIAADLSTMSTGRPSKDSGGVSMEVAAQKLNVSRSSVASAKTVKSKGTPELQEAVVSGKVDVKAAGKIATLPKEEQAAAVAEAKPPGKQPRVRPTAAAFNREKWRQKAEVTHSKLLAEAPADLQDWARGTFRDVTGGSLRREAKMDIPDGDDLSMYDTEDIISRIDGLLKEIPVAERKMVKADIGKHYVGDKPDQYLLTFSVEDTDIVILNTIVAELRHRIKAVEAYPDATKILKKAASELKKLTKAAGDTAE